MNHLTELTYLNENDLLAEEFHFLKSLYHLETSSVIHLNQKYHSKLVDEIGAYYKKQKYPWVDMINNLIGKGFILDYRHVRDAHSIKLDKIKLTPKFKETFFIPKKEAYQAAKGVYPPKMFNGKFAIYGRHDELEDYYYTKIIDGGNKHKHARFIEITKQLFDFDESVDSTGMARGALKRADVGWITYLQSFEDIANAFERDMQRDNWAVTVL